MQPPPEPSRADKIVKIIAIIFLTLVALILIGGGMIYAACGGLK